MASSIHGEEEIEKPMRGYAVQPEEAEKPLRGFSEQPEPQPRRGNKPMMPSNLASDDDSKVSFSCQNGTLFLKISSALMVFSFVLQTIAVGAPYWSAGWRRDKMSWHEGTWMTCYRLEMDNKWICSSYDYSSKTPGVPGWYTFCQAMGLVSIVIFLPALLINFFYTMHPKAKMFRGLLKFNFVLTFATALIPLLMVIVWAAGHPRRDRFPISYVDEDHDDDPFEFHFSFYFEIFAFLISLGAFVLEIWDFRQNDYYG